MYILFDSIYMKFSNRQTQWLPWGSLQLEGSTRGLVGYVDLNPSDIDVFSLQKFVEMYTTNACTFLHDHFNKKLNKVSDHGISGGSCLLLFLKEQPCGGERVQNSRPGP